MDLNVQDREETSLGDETPGEADCKTPDRQSKRKEEEEVAGLCEEPTAETKRKPEEEVSGVCEKPPAETSVGDETPGEADCKTLDRQTKKEAEEEEVAGL